VASLSQGRTAAAQCGLFTHKSVPVIFEPPCIFWFLKIMGWCCIPSAYFMKKQLTLPTTCILNDKKHWSS